MKPVSPQFRASADHVLCHTHLNCSEYFSELKRDLLPIGNALQSDHRLGLFQKILLTTDGTVTNLLSLYTGEEIRVTKLQSEYVPDIYGLVPESSPSRKLLRRCVLLSGRRNNYVHAESLLILDHHPLSIQRDLFESDSPIGLLWKRERLEMYREILGYRTEPVGALCIHFNSAPDATLLSRTYLVYHQKNLLGIVTEKFPLNYFLEA